MPASFSNFSSIGEWMCFGNLSFGGLKTPGEVGTEDTDPSSVTIDINNNFFSQKFAFYSYFLINFIINKIVQGQRPSFQTTIGGETFYNYHQSHPLPFKTIYARSDAYKFSFIPDTITHWNKLSPSIISSALNTSEPTDKFISNIRSFD